MVLLGTAFGLSLGVLDLPLEALVGVLGLPLGVLVDFGVEALGVLELPLGVFVGFGVEALGVDAFAASILSRRVLIFGELLVFAVLMFFGVPPFVLALVARKLALR